MVMAGIPLILLGYRRLAKQFHLRSERVVGLPQTLISKKKRREAGKPLPVEVDLETGKVVGTEASNYVRFLGQQVSMLCPGGHLNFSDVPQQYKDQVLNRIRYYFDIDGNPHRDLLMGTLYSVMAERYSERKTLRHKHFKQHYKKPEDWDTVLKFPPDYLNTETWKPVCELFVSEAFLNRSTKNKSNRQLMKYPTTQGTKSLASIRHGMGGPPGEHVVEAWKEIHVKKPSGNFVNELAAKDYEELIKELDRKRLERQSQSDTGTESESDTGYQFDVMETVLGQRSDYQRGVGKRLKGKGKKPIPQTQSTVPPQPTTEMMSTVADIFSAMRATWGGNLTPEQRAQIFNPRFDNFVQTYSQSQSPGGSSSQSHAAPPEQQQQPPTQPQFQPSSQQQFQNLSQQQFENFLQQQPQSFPQQFPQQQQQSAPPMGNQFLYRTPSESPPLGSNFVDFGLFGSSSQENQFFSTPIFNQAELGNLTLGLSSDQAYVPSPPRASGTRTENNPDQDFIIRDLNEDVNE
ncbi:hypothetical protein CsatB_013903 [Cannabis sativa]